MIKWSLIDIDDFFEKPDLRIDYKPAGFCNTYLTYPKTGVKINKTD
jgi:hypothetical protein